MSAAPACHTIGSRSERRVIARNPANSAHGTTSVRAGDPRPPARSHQLGSLGIEALQPDCGSRCAAARLARAGGIHLGAAYRTVRRPQGRGRENSRRGRHFHHVTRLRALAGCLDLQNLRVTQMVRHRHEAVERNLEPRDQITARCSSHDPRTAARDMDLSSVTGRAPCATARARR